MEEEMIRFSRSMAELSQRDMGLKELPRPEQTYDFSLLDEIAKR